MYGSKKYGYLNTVAGIANTEFDNSVAYIKGWMEALKNDKRLIVFASSYAQRAVDYILNTSYSRSEKAGEQQMAYQ